MSRRHPPPTPSPKRETRGDRDGVRVERDGGSWRLAGEGFDGLIVVNEFIGYLVDRNYAPLTVRAYAYDLLHFARWMAAEQLSINAVDVDVLLRYLRACRTQVLPGQHGGNVFSIRNGRSTGYAPRTVNRRLAALSGLFLLIEMRDPKARSAIPTRRQATGWTAPGERAGLLGHLATPAPRSGLRVREPRRLPRGLQRREVAELLASFHTIRDRAIAGLMLFSGIRSAEVRALQASDVDIALGWVRVLGKGDKERRVPVAPRSRRGARRRDPATAHRALRSGRARRAARAHHDDWTRLLRMPDRRTRHGKRDLALLHLLGSVGGAAPKPPGRSSPTSTSAAEPATRGSGKPSRLHHLVDDPALRQTRPHPRRPARRGRPGRDRRLGQEPPHRHHGASPALAAAHRPPGTAEHARHRRYGHRTTGAPARMGTGVIRVPAGNRVPRGGLRPPGGARVSLGRCAPTTVSGDHGSRWSWRSRRMPSMSTPNGCRGSGT